MMIHTLDQDIELPIVYDLARVWATDALRLIGINFEKGGGGFRGFSKGSWVTTEQRVDHALVIVKFWLANSSRTEYHMHVSAVYNTDIILFVRRWQVHSLKGEPLNKSLRLGNRNWKVVEGKIVAERI